ncbi:MAG: hypothetical protein ACPGNV_08545 [Mangrovicoccus sp.]
MTRIKKVSTNTENNDDPQLADELRRFIAHASDMIEEQRAVRLEIQEARNALEHTRTACEKSSRAIVRRQSEAVSVDIRSDIAEAHGDLVRSLTAPLIQAQEAAHQLRGLAFWSGLSGGVLGGATVILSQIIGRAMQ